MLARCADPKRPGSWIDRVIRLVRRGHTDRVEQGLATLRSQVADTVASGWLKMTLGMVGFFGLYYVLFLLCTETTGIELPFGQLFAAYAIGRLLTAVGVTPGGLGVTETGTAAALVAWGADPAASMAGVVLFSIFTHFLEIPLGALGWVAWSLMPRATSDELADADTGRRSVSRRADAPDGCAPGARPRRRAAPARRAVPSPAPPPTR